MLKELFSRLLNALLLSAISLGTILFIVKGIVDLSYTGIYAWPQYVTYFITGMIGVTIIMIAFETIEMLASRNRR
ncbi:hypothetical protein ACFQ22_07845 [Lentilactobacillus raoultii]|uniref:Uncharacterized protein n=1 Tax=Lentilactobacillus raoultii TaxID=1987503 RepID=A0ABW3PSW5_9LACO|nr:hypothetical protein [Lentilactobacillus raoultii]